jgi:hypothetical protein
MPTLRDSPATGNNGTNRAEEIGNVIRLLERDRYGSVIIQHVETGDTKYVQSDWDIPGIATSFGANIDDTLPASKQIAAAGEWIDENWGVTAEDPGYFC